MKSIVKIALAFALGIVVTTTIILPKMNGQAEPAETPQTLETQIQAAVNEAVTLALTKSEEPSEAVQIEVEAVSEPEQIAEVMELAAEVIVEVEAEPTHEPQKVEVKAEPTPAVASSPQVKKTEPEYFYEDGKKYTYINGFKCLITDEPDVQLDFYDWENDPLGKVAGPFTGNGN